MYSFDIGGSADAVLAAGAKEKVVFWDLRLAASNKQLPIGATFGESHTDDITRVSILTPTLYFSCRTQFGKFISMECLLYNYCI